MPSRLSKFLQTIAVASATTVGAFVVATKHCVYEPLDPSTDKTFKSVFFKRFNPNNNPCLQDVCVRRIPLFKLQPELVKDQYNGGTKLVEKFCGGVWGGLGYTVQRRAMRYKYRNDSTTAHQLWDKKELLESSYSVGTEITDHFVVLEKTPQSILVRCGASPLDTPDGPRASDGLFEINAITCPEKGYAEFQLKSVFFSGMGKVDKKPFEDSPTIEWLHRQYAKLLMESAIRHCQVPTFNIGT